MSYSTTEKIIVATDLHYGLGRNSKSKLKILKDFVEPQILGELTSDDLLKTMVICGDLFHEMVSVRTDIYKEAKRFLMACAEHAHIILIAGNHDCFEDTTDVTSVEMFEQLDNIEVLRFPSTRTLYGKECLFLPWSDNNTTSLRYTEPEKFDYIFCHPDVPKEFFMNLYVLESSKRVSATERNQKMIDEEEILQSGLEVLRFSDGNRNDKIVSNLDSISHLIKLAKPNGDIFAGHIHKHSESHILGRTFRFVGAPYQTTSEEINSKSGYYVISNGKIEFKEISAPEFVRIKFSDVKKTGVDEYDFSSVSGNIVQFDADDVISVELEAKLKKKIIDAKPYEISDTDYSNLVMESQSIDNGQKYEKAFASSPRNCLVMYTENIPDETFKLEEVSKTKIIENFEKLYDLIEKRMGVVETDGGANVNYKKLVASNFLSYETLEFDFEKYKGITLIYGKNLDNPGATNACGKSNIIKAISYALFGRYPKKVKKENMVVWEKPKSDVNVSIFLESNGVNYRIDSGMIKGKDSYHRVFNLDTDKEITKKQLAETRKMIETEILHCGFDMFMKTTILTSSEIFNFYSMKKEDKDDYLNTIFGTKVLAEIRDVIKGYLKDNRAAYLEKSRLLDSKQHDIDLNVEASKRFETNRETTLKKLKEEIDAIKLQIEEAVVNENPEIENERATQERIKRDIELNISKHNAILQDRRTKFIKDSSDLQKYETAIKVMKTELSKHKSVLPSLCSDCKKIAVDGYNLSSYPAKLKSLRESVALVKDDISVAETTIKNTETMRDNLIKQLMEVERKIGSLKNDNEIIRKLEYKIKANESSMENMIKLPNPNTEIIKKLEAERDEITKDVESLFSTIRHLDFILNKIVSQDVVTNLLTSRFIQQLNERIRFYLQRLGLNLGVEFDNDFQYEFIRGNGNHPEFNSLSGGESLRIVIATSFAFKDFLESRRNISSNIRFLDEFFEKDTDNLGMNLTISILKDFSKIMNQNVFLISNKLNEIDDKMFDNTLVVTIKDSKSSITEEHTNAISV